MHTLIQESLPIDAHTCPTPPAISAEVLPWSEFFSACAKVRLKRGRKPTWRKAFDRRVHGDDCAMCSTSLTAEHANLVELIPVELGGTTSPDNEMVVCSDCLPAISDTDLLLLPELNPATSGEILRRRLYAFESALNHKAPSKSSNSKQEIRAHLMKRWAYPRTSAKVFAGETFGLIAFHREHNSGGFLNGLGVLMRSQGMVMETKVERRWVGFAIKPERVFDAIELLIERNCLLQKVALEGFCGQKESTKFTKTWWLHGKHLSECSGH